MHLSQLAIGKLPLYVRHFLYSLSFNCQSLQPNKLHFNNENIQENIWKNRCQLLIEHGPLAQNKQVVIGNKYILCFLKGRTGSSASAITQKKWNSLLKAFNILYIYKYFLSRKAGAKLCKWNPITNTCCDYPVPYS